MSNRELVDWSVPADSLAPWIDWIAEKHGTHCGYVGFEAEEAMRLFLDEDVGADAEETIKDWRAMAGLAHTSGEKKNPGQPKWDFTRQLNADLTDRFRARVDEINDRRDDLERRVHYGEALAWALDEHRGGGRLRRLAERIDQLDDAVRGALSEAYGDDGEKLGTCERRRVKIRRDLMAEFDDEIPRDALVDAIKEHAGESKPTIETYEDKVVDELGFCEHPKARKKPGAPTIYVSPERAEEIREASAEERRERAEAELATATATPTDDGAADRDPGARDDAGRDDAAAQDGDGGEAAPTLSTAQRQLMETIDGVDPEDPEHRQAARDGRLDELDLDQDQDQDQDREQDQGDAADQDTDQDTDQEPEPEIALAADGGVALDGAAPIPQLTCPCCGAIVPTHVDSEVRDGRAIKECPTCRQPVDLEAAATAVARDRARGSGSSPGEPPG